MSQHLLELHRFVLHEIGKINDEKILDIGCGRGVWGYLIRESSENAYTIGVELYKPHLTFCKRHNVYSDVILADVRCLPFKNSVFNITICCELIEHLKKKDGQKFLDEAERASKQKIIISTPNGFRPTGNVVIPYKDHLSGWNTTDFKGRGYKVRGIGFAQFKDAEESGLWWLWGTMFYMLTPIVYVVPWASGWLIAVKIKNKNIRQ
jgi:2-polyprenyl-3-methyl-5-hydroxy-6-metoxy-1,4-benzoquinol methylase